MGVCVCGMPSYCLAVSLCLHWKAQSSLWTCLLLCEQKAVSVSVITCTMLSVGVWGGSIQHCCSIGVPSFFRTITNQFLGSFCDSDKQAVHIKVKMCLSEVCWIGTFVSAVVVLCLKLNRMLLQEWIQIQDDVLRSTFGFSYRKCVN